MSRRSAPWQVWMADLSPIIGSEPSGRRPVVVVSSPFYTSFPIHMTIVVPLTTKDRGLPHHTPMSSPQSGLRRQSWARTDDIRAVSERRLIGRALGSADDKEIEDIRTHLRLMLDI